VSAAQSTDYELLHGYLIHPVAAWFPLLDEQELTALAIDIDENGLQEPIVRFMGLVVDGRNRLAACALAAVDPEFREWEGDEEDLVAWILSKNLHRRHLTTSQRAAIAARLAGRPSDGSGHDPGKFAGVPTQAEAAKLLGVSERSVRDARVVLERSPELLAKVQAGEVSVSAAAAEVRPKPAPTVAEQLEQQGWGSLVGGTAPADLEPEAAGHLAALDEGIEDDDSDEALIVARPGAAPPTPTPSAPRPVDPDSWSTPDDIIERVKAAFGGAIDLDPATNEAAQARIGATTYYTAERDGLGYTWRGQVWLQPPYSHPLVEQFTSKLLQELDAGNVTEAMVLLNVATDTKWQQALFRPGGLICLIRGRIQFVDENNEPGTSPRHAQIVLYFGNRPSAFREAFGDLGTIVTVTG
jgi:ParB family chromosome partitioning protein